MSSVSPTCIRLASGVLLDLAAPDPTLVCLSDIATSLSRQERFTGHSLLRPTVAQHSLAVEWIAGEMLRGGEDGERLRNPAAPPDCDPARLDRAVRRAALMHDATEAYCSDVSAPAKRAMRGENVMGETIPSDFDVLEARLAPVIADALRCAVPEGFAGLIHQADTLAYQYESCWCGWGADTEPPPSWVERSPYVRRCYRHGFGVTGTGQHYGEPYAAQMSAAMFAQRAVALVVPA